MESIAISYIDSYGERGSSLGEFEYPRGLSNIGKSVVICDTQNNRVQISDLISSNSEIGVGTLSFPDSILWNSSKSSFFITDSDNHVVREYSASGTLKNTFGERGTGDGQFDFPSGIAQDETYFYVADRQNNRIQRFLISDFSYVDEVGGMLLPEGVCVLNGFIYVMDSGNGILKQYDIAFNLIREKKDFLGGYGTRVENIGGVLAVVDNIDSAIYFLNENLEDIRSYTEGLFFPEGVLYLNDKLYITQPHEVRIYSITIEFGLQFLDEFERLNQQLYPTGRAWWRPFGSVLSKMNQAFSLSDSRLYSAIQNTQLSIIADNYSISDIDVERWEVVYGVKSSGTKQQRIDLIRQRMAYPGNVLARQSKGFIEAQLQEAGFDVYFHYSGTYNPTSAIHGNFVFGNTLHGQVPSAYSVCANNIQESRDADFNIGSYLKSIFYVGGETFGSIANVPSARKDEFRELILKLKPAHSVALLFINYI